MRDPPEWRWGVQDGLLDDPHEVEKGFLTRGGVPARVTRLPVEVEACFHGLSLEARAEPGEGETQIVEGVLQGADPNGLIGVPATRHGERCHGQSTGPVMRVSCQTRPFVQANLPLLQCDDAGVALLDLRFAVAHAEREGTVHRLGRLEGTVHALDAEATERDQGHEQHDCGEARDRRPGEGEGALGHRRDHQDADGGGGEDPAGVSTEGGAPEQDEQRGQEHSEGERGPEEPGGECEQGGTRA